MNIKELMEWHYYQSLTDSPHKKVHVKAFELLACLENKAPLYPFDSLAPGASFFVPVEKESSIRTLVSKQNKIDPERHFKAIKHGSEGTIEVRRVR